MTPLSSPPGSPLDPPSGARRPTMKHVARLAGVGIKTVSRVVNGEPNVSAEMTARVQAAVEQLQYQPDLHAGNLRRADRRTNTLGLLVGSVANPFSGAVHRAVEEVAKERRVAVFASSLDDDPERERSSVDAFLARRVDGLILTTIAPSQAYLGVAASRGTPLVFVDRVPAGLEADSVIVDNAAGISRAVAHLADQGHRRIAFLGDRPEIFTARERERGFVEEMQRRGLPVAPELVLDGAWDERVAEALAERLLALPEPPTAIVSGQNLITIGVITALRRHDAHRSIALVGFDDLPLAALLDPAVTVIAQDPSGIGHAAAERVFARLDGDAGPAQAVVVPTTLIVRGSGEVPRHA
ncbi:LacI family transcriptional regulator [Clavibacter michiganensis subsp. michiganensis]|uniref:LacI family DNA-binding transcriptional regulator n=2 Tax=Clavibacter michiganensis TaxID=28447 RepID=UPI000B8CD095|nr:LacI family DNA-binding transcriptional regulator [Clavibacter michiganensis]MWJ19571.1 LacI family transcriptional regulator [Clavibacter michiganensis subsp. michiganensis]